VTSWACTNWIVRRPRHQRCCQVEPAAHATGVTLYDPVGRVGQVELGQQFGRPGL
jgi:hypothetical protein